jgi:hypothetical protein
MFTQTLISLYIKNECNNKIGISPDLLFLFIFLSNLNLIVSKIDAQSIQVCNYVRQQTLIIPIYYTSTITPRLLGMDVSHAAVRWLVCGLCSRLKRRKLQNAGFLRFALVSGDLNMVLAMKAALKKWLTYIYILINHLNPN